MPQTHSTQTLHEYSQLHYFFDIAYESGDQEEMISLSNQIKAYEKRWSLPCSSTSLQE
jgi:hypothetical protein